MSEDKVPNNNNILIPLDDQVSEVESILPDDGHIIATNPVRVVPRGSKVSTGHGSTYKSEDEIGKIPEKLGKKSSEQVKVGLNSLRSKFGFSWKKIGRKFFVAGFALAIFGIIGVSTVAAWAVGIWSRTEPVDLNQGQSSTIYARDGKTVIYKIFKDEKREIVPLVPDTNDQSANYIPIHMQLAMLGLEDENFYYNKNGIPVSNIAGAAITCFTTVGNECRGASGISQQLRKNLTNESDVTISRKVEELFAAVKMNQELNHNRILELYLNEVSFSRNSAGVQEAAQSYFGKDIKDVTIPEACYLAALVQKNGIFSASINNRESAAWFEFESRKNTCLDKLHQVKFRDDLDIVIQTEEELNAYKAIDVTFIPFNEEFPYPHFRDYVLEELKKFNISEQALYTRGYEIITTIDPVVQQRTVDAINSRLEANVLAFGANNVASMVVDVPTGEILAMVGSRDYYNTEIDGQVNVLTTPQQPGSSVKPYVYAAAMEKGFNPGTVVIDAQTDFGGGYVPLNFSRSFVGPTNFRSALANSYNIPAVKAGYLAAGVGTTPNATAAMDSVFGFAEKAGLQFPCIPAGDNIDDVSNCSNKEYAKTSYRRRCGVSAFLGGCEIEPVSHADGINTIANNGTRVELSPFISIVENIPGDVPTTNDIYKRVQESENPVYARTENAIPAPIANQVANIMADYNARIPAFGNSRFSLQLKGWDGDNAVAAKTGTTNDVRDTWSVGFTPYYTVIVWVGNTDNSPMNSRSSGNTAAPVWNAVMTNIHSDKEPRPLSKEGLIPIKLSPVTGFPSDTGYVEYLTQDQINKLNQAGSQVSKPEYNPRANSIFSNMSAIIPRTLKINKIDNKIAVEGKTLEVNIEEIQCIDFLSEFPAAENWFAPVRAYAERIENPCPSEVSDQDQSQELNNKPGITVSGLTNNGNAAAVVTINASITGIETKIIDKIEIFVNGNPAANVAQNGNTVTWNTLGTSGPATVLIRVTDSFGAVNEISYSGVTFGAVPTLSITGPLSIINANTPAQLRGTSTQTLITPEFIISQGSNSITCTPTLSAGTYGCTLTVAQLSVFTDGPATIVFKDNTSGAQISSPVTIDT